MNKPFDIMGAMKKVGVVGVGTMGCGIADNFLKNGYEVFVWNRTPEKAQDLVEKGAQQTKSPKQAAEKSDIVIEVTANDESSLQVWQGTEGILAGADSKKRLITCATLSVEHVGMLARDCEDKGFTFFDMPMTGGRIGAVNGQLILLASGDPVELDKIKSDLMAIAKDIKYFGSVGSGTKYKLILNSLQAIHIVGFGEAMRMAKEVGLDESVVGDALSQLPGGYTTSLSWQCYQSEPKPVNFSVEWEAKDLGYASKMVKEDYPLRDKAKEKFDQAEQAGHGRDDWTKVNKLD